MVRGRGAVALEVGKFALAGVVALFVVGLGTSIASRRIGEREAIFDARTTALAKAQGLVQPALEDAILTGSAAAVARLDAVMGDVLDRSLVRTKLWSESGTIVYSDEARLIGRTYRLGEEGRDSLATGRIDAEVSDLSKPENRFERSYGQLLEVYLPVRTPSGTPLLFEAYFRYSLVSDNGSHLWRSFAPIALGALVFLELVQVPLAWSLARRLRLRLQEREVLLERALQASEVERRQIASDLHDGVVQDLAGVAYSLSAAARSGNGSGPGGGAVDQAAEAIRSSIKSLRSLVVDIYPPDFGEEPLDTALGDLLDRARTRGLRAELEVDAPDPIPDHTARLVYRVVQEGIRNAVNHAGAGAVRVRLGTGGRRATVEVIDDGRGFDEHEVGERAAAGHVGLRALSGLLADNGGTLEVRSAPGEGTTLRAEVPL